MFCLVGRKHCCFGGEIRSLSVLRHDLAEFNIQSSIFCFCFNTRNFQRSFRFRSMITSNSVLLRAFEPFSEQNPVDFWNWAFLERMCWKRFLSDFIWYIRSKGCLDFKLMRASSWWKIHQISTFRYNFDVLTSWANWLITDQVLLFLIVSGKGQVILNQSLYAVLFHCRRSSLEFYWYLYDIQWCNAFLVCTVYRFFCSIYTFIG